MTLRHIIGYLPLRKESSCPAYVHFILHPASNRRWARRSQGLASQQQNALDRARKWIISELFASYAFPVDWLRKQVNPIEWDASAPGNRHLIGLMANTRDGYPFLLVVLAARGNAQSAEDALRASLANSHTAGVGLASDGTTAGTVFLRRRFDSQKCDYIADIEPYALKVAAPRATHPLFAGNSNERIDPADLVPLADRIEHLFFELHSHIRDVDGMHADEALDELCKLIYAKLYDEECAEGGARLRLWRQFHGTSEEFAATTRAVYQEANEYDLRVFRLKIPQYDRSRGVFTQPLRLSSPAIVKVMEELQEYSLTRSDADVKGRAFQRVLTPAVRSGMGQYFTPELVVSFIVNAVAPRISDLILDPFCGSAHFLSRSLQFVRNSGHKPESKAFHEFAFGKLHGIEKSDRMVRVAMTDMRLHGDGHSNIRCTDALLDFANYPDLEPASFDVVLTNPPFGSLLGAESISQLGRFHLADGRGRVPLEVLGLERCIQFLRPADAWE